MKPEVKVATSDSSESEEDRIGEDGMQESIYKKRNYYVQSDLVNFYEGTRFTLPFMVYRAINYWYLFDAFAKYANIFIASVYIYACLYMAISFLNIINLFVLVAYFFAVTRRVGIKAENIQRVTSVQS